MVTRKEAEERLKRTWERFNMPTSNPFYFAVQTLVEDIRQDMYATVEDAFKDGYDWGWIDSGNDNKYLDKGRLEDWLDVELKRYNDECEDEE